MVEFLRYLRELGYILPLHREAQASTAQHNVKGFIKHPNMVYGNVGAVVARYVVPFQSPPTGHNSSHRGKHLLLNDSLT